MTNITFRSQLISGIHVFCAESNLRILSTNVELVELIILLAKYREEGVSLCPHVYITNDIDGLVRMIPDGEKIRIGIETHDSNGIKNSIKKCAPLSQHGWNTYISETQESIEYGVFKGSSNPIAVNIDEIILSNTGEINTVKIFQAAEDCVEIKSNKSLTHHIFLNHKDENAPPPQSHLSSLVDALTKKTSSPDLEAIKALMIKTLSGALREAHGCLITVTHMPKPPAFLKKDGITLDAPINFPELVSQLRSGDLTADVLNSRIALLKGMINTDGIILFNEQCCLLGYNYFMALPKNNNISGGARRRAFAGLNERIGRGLSASFMQSQDGWTEFEGI